jgi:hypothetical protein
MTIPPDPMQTPSPIQPGSQQPTPGTPSSMDPTGAWSKFLSTPGGVASPEEVKMFMNGMLKMFNGIIQQQNEAHKRASDQLKKAIEGED